MKLAPGQGRLQHVAGIHGPLGRAGPDQRVKLVDEQDDLPLGADHFLEDRLQPLLELAPELGPGDQRPEVEDDHPFVTQRVRHVAGHDPAGEPLHDGRLADPRLADQDRVVLGAPREHLDDAANLLVPADDRIELLPPGERRQVAPILFERLVLVLGSGIGDPLAAPHVDQCLEESLPRDPRGGHDLLHRVAGQLVAESQQQVVGRDVVILELGGLLLGLVQDLCQIRRDELPRHGSGDSGQPIDGGLQLGRQPFGVGPQLVEHRPRGSPLLLHQGEEEVKRVDGLLAVGGGEGAGALQGFLCLDGQSVGSHGVLASSSKNSRLIVHAVRPNPGHPGGHRVDGSLRLMGRQLRRHTRRNQRAGHLTTERANHSPGCPDPAFGPPVRLSCRPGIIRCEITPPRRLQSI
ncbi:MAG: hypothetical protein FD129_2067 [bacterium]|nr:MAG: hypothetical protein FD129_2067 [bacterium]